MASEVKKQTRQIPIVAIRGSVVFPHTDAVLSFGRKKSVAAVNSAFQENRILGIFTQKDPRVQDPGVDDLYKIGTIVTITQMMSTEGEIHAIVRGQARIKLKEVVESKPYFVAKVEEYRQEQVDVSQVEALANKIKELFKKVINLGKQTEIMTVMRLVSGKVNPGELADQVASILEIKTSKKQELLETFNLKKRLTKVHQYLSHEVNVLELERTISTKTQKRFEDQMRKAVLREKKKTIEEELGEIGEGDLGSEELREYKKKIKDAKMPKEVKKKADKELKRLSQLSPHNPEGGYIRNYLDWLTEMPWSKLSPNKVSIKHAAKVLEEDHYGLKKVKERIIEYLAVMKVKKTCIESRGKSKKGKNNDGDYQPTILCFIGPPGVGKTSIGKSIARALGRKFVRMSLGGIRDEAEIRGHRRTYVGALPGRIIQGIRNAGTRNPVFMLDEIDKLGVDFRGDPSSALLEALDPEQNKEFSDHYLEVPFDLSQVMFICTGNVLESMPPALRDRMEIINFPGYTQDEKYHIADEFLWPKQLRLHGLEGLLSESKSRLKASLKGRASKAKDRKVQKSMGIKEEAVNEIINRYTREAGVRSLERNLATVCRKVARLVAERKKYPKVLRVSDVRRFLGPQKYTSLIAEKKDEVGMATGLAVTPSGGEILFIEVSLMPGKGKLTLTGHLGDVMKESGQAAFTWAKSHWSELGLKESFGRKIDVHIHVPEGAVPKDGPSAGIAMATALVSALTGVPTKRYVGMTGEVTLRGRVLEIGGVKEKVIAGHRAGLKTIVLSKDNKKDLEDIPKKVMKDINFVFTNNLSEVLEIALKKWPVAKFKKQISQPRPTYLATA